MRGAEAGDRALVWGAYMHVCIYVCVCESSYCVFVSFAFVVRHLLCHMQDVLPKHRGEGTRIGFEGTFGGAVAMKRDALFQLVDDHLLGVRP